MEKELETLLQNTGDGIAAMFEQMIKGDWTDDNGHKVAMNVQMQNMKTVLRDIMKFRNEHMGYSPVGGKDNGMG